MLKKDDSADVERRVSSLSQGLFRRNWELGNQASIGERDGFCQLAGRDFMGFFGFFNDSNWENVRISRVTLQCVKELFVMGIDANPPN